MKTHNRCTLLIDANWLLMSRVAVTINNFNMDQPDFVKEQSQKELGYF